MKKKNKNRGGRPKISGELRNSLRVRERGVSSSAKVLKEAERLYFPPKKRGEKEGDYKVRKFIYFCGSSGYLMGNRIKL